jgi:hypothetical protein
MNINTPVRFKVADHSSDLSARQAAAVGQGIGIVIAAEQRDGQSFVDVLFAVYGATFTGIPAADLVALAVD